MNVIFSVTSAKSQTYGLWQLSKDLCNELMMWKDQVRDICDCSWDLTRGSSINISAKGSLEAHLMDYDGFHWNDGFGKQKKHNGWDYLHEVIGHNPPDDWCHELSDDTYAKMTEYPKIRYGDVYLCATQFGVGLEFATTDGDYVGFVIPWTLLEDHSK